MAPKTKAGHGWYAERDIRKNKPFIKTVCLQANQALNKSASHFIIWLTSPHGLLELLPLLKCIGPGQRSRDLKYSLDFL